MYSAATSPSKVVCFVLILALEFKDYVKSGKYSVGIGVESGNLIAEGVQLDGHVVSAHEKPRRVTGTDPSVLHIIVNGCQATC